MVSTKARHEIRYPEEPFTSQENPMPPKKRTYRVLNIRLDTDTDKALQELMKLHGTRKTQSDLIRDAIIEKYKRDRKNPPQYGD